MSVDGFFHDASVWEEAVVEEVAVVMGWLVGSPNQLRRRGGRRVWDLCDPAAGLEIFRFCPNCNHSSGTQITGTWLWVPKCYKPDCWQIVHGSRARRHRLGEEGEDDLA